MPAPSAITALVGRFQDNRDSYTAPGYNEAQLRSEFLDPFFDALGWDVYNRQGYAEAYKEVIHEDAVKVGTATKAPDYSFRIGGVRKFFVEAKKPSVSIKDDPSPAFQLRRYAWSAKLPLSTLSNFAEFAVYDCRQKPDKNDKASVGRIFYFTADEFESRWDEIASLFTKEAILKGSFDKFASGARRGKGTAEVDDAFLADIEEWRFVLAKNIAIRNPSLSMRQLNFAVQRTIDRLIFLRICEDRGIEDYGRLQAHLNGERIYERLCTVFREADDRYNSGLFHFKDEKERGESPDTVTLALSIDDKILREIVSGLYYPESPYEFSVLPADILGQVYEQFLGKVIRLTAGHQAKVEDKPEVRKAGGVFYTPTYIVDYIVKNTVGKLLDCKTPREASNLRILDPACGSGSFLIGAYQYLLDWHRDWYLKNDPAKWTKGKNAALYKTGIGEYRLTTPERKRILLNNIYGVDIDTQAVEVTKLSLLLKVLEGETEQTIAQQLRLFHTRALPDLGNNIKCGNSLIGTDFYEGSQESLSLFEDEEEKYRINAFDWDGKDGFQEIMRAGGFDAVIGNPPYVKVQELEYSIIDYFKEKYDVAWQRIDISILFAEKAIQLLNSSGINGFIITNQFLSTEYGRKARKFLIEKTQILKVIDFGDLPVFHNALTYVSIFFLKKGRIIDFNYYRLNKLCPEIECTDPIKIFSNLIGDDPWVLERKDKINLISKLSIKCLRLDAFAKCWAGLFTGKDDLLMFDTNQIKNLPFENDILLPVIRAQDCDRFSFAAPSKSVIYPYIEDHDKTIILEENILLKKFPKAYAYLKTHKAELQKRKDSRKEFSENKKWYALTRFGRYSIFKRPKIVSPGEVKKNKFALDETGSGFSCARVFAITCENNSIDIKILLGVLNSKLIEFILHSIAPLKQGGYYSYSSSFIDQLPMPDEIISGSKRAAKLGNIVSTMLDLNKKLAASRDDQEKTLLSRRIDSTDRQIDKLVYELYGLTEEEIRIVEGS